MHPQGVAWAGINRAFGPAATVPVQIDVGKATKETTRRILLHSANGAVPIQPGATPREIRRMGTALKGRSSFGPDTASTWLEPEFCARPCAPNNCHLRIQTHHPAKYFLAAGRALRARRRGKPKRIHLHTSSAKRCASAKGGRLPRPPGRFHRKIILLGSPRRHVIMLFGIGAVR